MALRIEVLDQWPTEAAMLHAWHRLAPTPMQSPAWYESWWQSMQDARKRLCIVVVQHGEHLVGIVPCYIQRNWSGWRCLRLLGDEHACSDYQGVLISEDHREAGYALLSDFFRTEIWPRHAQFGVWDGLSCDDESTQRWLQALQACGHEVTALRRINTWRLDCTGGWKALLQRTSRHERRTARRLFDRIHEGNSLQLEFLDRPPALAEAVEQCLSLHRQNWSARPERDSLNSPQMERFLYSMASALGSQGACEAVRLKYRGAVIGVLLCLVDSRQNRYFYQLGWSRYHARLSPGRMMFIAAIHRTCQRRGDYVDFLRGDEAYKARMRAAPLPAQQVRVIPPQFRSRCYGQVLHFVDALRKGAATARRALLQAHTHH
ncbi:MAG: glycosyl transferase [Pirellulaceae bacterium]|nr:MAG: glycosyl transferase [Pirellulaceae bacterium]